MKRQGQQPDSTELPQVSRFLLRTFATFSRGYLHRHFHSVRLLRSGLQAWHHHSSVVIFLNHASWWDPLVCLLLARAFFPEHASYAPISAAMLERYRFFRRLGFFPVRDHSPRSALYFLETAHTLLARGRTALWITPQGRFMDPRERPLRFENGLGALASGKPRATFLPLALEYTFWAEPRPEILCAFGEPVEFDVAGSGNIRKWTNELSEALEFTQDELAERSCRRDPADWIILDRGKSGVNAVYDTWRWLNSKARGKSFTPEHQPTR